MGKRPRRERTVEEKTGVEKTSREKTGGRGETCGKRLGGKVQVTLKYIFFKNFAEKYFFS